MRHSTLIGLGAVLPSHGDQAQGSAQQEINSAIDDGDEKLSRRQSLCFGSRCERQPDCHKAPPWWRGKSDVQIFRRKGRAVLPRPAGVQLRVQQIALECKTAMEEPMINPLRIVVLTALTIFVVASSSTGAVAKAPQLFCENSKDCPPGDRCKITHHHDKKTGVCVGASSRVTRKPY